jgi:hypothetical protein
LSEQNETAEQFAERLREMSFQIARDNKCDGPDRDEEPTDRDIAQRLLGVQMGLVMAFQEFQAWAGVDINSDPDS